MGSRAVKPDGPALASPREDLVKDTSTKRVSDSGSEGLSNGPLENRRCTDCMCCGVFTVFVVVWIAVGLYGYAQGDPRLLTYPFDSDGNQCGRPGSSTSSFPCLYWPFPLPSTFEMRVCVESCPATYNATVNCFLNSAVHSCDFTYENMFDSPDPLLGYVRGVYPSKTFLKRFCVPQQVAGWASIHYSAVMSKLNVDSAVKWMSDVFVVWETLLIVAGFAVLSAIAYFVLIRYCVGVIIWLSIFFILLMIFSVGAVLLWTAKYMYQDDAQEDTRKTLKVTAYVVFAIGACFGLYILYMCKRIRLAIAILKSAALYIRDVKASLLIPPAFFLLTVGIYVYWLLATLYIYSSGAIQSSKYVIPEAHMDKTARDMYYYHFFGVLWINSFLISLQEFVLAASVCIWYFSQNSDSGPQRPISRGLYWAFRYHLGSIAFGALILAIVKLTKWVMRYVSEKLQKVTGQNRLLQALIVVLNCFVSCFERFVKFINRNAFIQIALKSTSFCTACKDAFFLILRNAMTFATLGSIGGVFIFLGKWVVCLLSSYMGYLLLTHSDRFGDEIHSPVFPVIVSGIQSYLLLTYVIASVFMAVYSSAIDAILQCYLLDDEISKQRGEFAPAHAPIPILDFMGRERDKMLTLGASKSGPQGCCRCC